MKKLTLTLLGLSALAAAGCTTRETEVVHAPPTVVKETRVIERTAPTTTIVRERTAPVTTTTTTTSNEVVVVDQHRSWWEIHHAPAPYDRDRAIALHRVWCAENPGDGSCRGWN